MNRITDGEMTVLRGFNEQWKNGDGYWLIDHLACRGLLERMENVDPLYMHRPTTIQLEKGQRSSKCHYRITRRGTKALRFIQRGMVMDEVDDHD